MNIHEQRELLITNIILVDVVGEEITKLPANAGVVVAFGALKEAREALAQELRYVEAAREATS